MFVHKEGEELFTLDNLLWSWHRFRSGKAKKQDVQSFERHLEDNLFALHHDLTHEAYRHGPYRYFPIFDNKKRNIHQPTVRDRVVHQALYDYLMWRFRPLFIVDSYASLVGKGVHRAVKTLRYFIRLAGGGRDCFVLKCDIRRYFDHVSHNILLAIIKSRVPDGKIQSVIREVISSYHLAAGSDCGVPLGNVTSQIFANIYLDRLDHFIKERLGVRFYLRYNDDLVIVDTNHARLERWREAIQSFVREELALEIPLTKTSIRQVRWGINFLGFIILPNGVLLRHQTKAKIFHGLKAKNIQSKLATLKHCRSFNLRQKLKAQWSNREDLLH